MEESRDRERSEDPMPAYNVFRSKRLDELCCAVPEGRAVPRFVTEPAWEFDRKLDPAAAPRGFDRDAAKVGVRFNGFYLFQVL
jgi:broad specificity phosphatase PhoE